MKHVRHMTNHALNRHCVAGVYWWICQVCGWKGRKPTGGGGQGRCPGPRR